MKARKNNKRSTPFAYISYTSLLLMPQFRSFSGDSSRFAGPSGGKGCSALPSAAGTRWHTPHPPPRHAALPGGSQVVLRCGRRAWQEGPLTEGSGPSASSGALEPSLMEDPRPPRRSPRTAGGLWGSGESGSPALRPAGLLFRVGSGGRWCPWGFMDRESGFLPRSGMPSRLSPRTASTHLSLPCFLPSRFSFQLPY